MKHSTFGIVCFKVPVWSTTKPANPPLYRTPPLAATMITAEFKSDHLAATCLFGGAGKLFVGGLSAQMRRFGSISELFKTNHSTVRDELVGANSRVKLPRSGESNIRRFENWSESRSYLKCIADALAVSRNVRDQEADGDQRHRSARRSMNRSECRSGSSSKSKTRSVCRFMRRSGEEAGIFTDRNSQTECRQKTWASPSKRQKPATSSFSIMESRQQFFVVLVLRK